MNTHPLQGKSTQQKQSPSFFFQPNVFLKCLESIKFPKHFIYRKFGEVEL